MKKVTGFTKILIFILVCALTLSNLSVTALAASKSTEAQSQGETATEPKDQLTEKQTEIKDTEVIQTEPKASEKTKASEKMETETELKKVTRSGGKSGGVTITSDDQLKPYFPDDNFRAVVLAAVSDGKDGAVGTDVVDALGNFTGDVNAKKKKTDPMESKITNVTGIDLLRKANIIDLTYNHISDFSTLGKNASANGDEFKTWYGLTPEEYNEDMNREATTNVFWILDGNPIEKIPENFGGRLVIDSPANTSYTYPEDLSGHYTYLRPDSGSVSGSLDISKTKIIDNGTEKNVNVISVAEAGHSTHLLDFKITEGEKPGNIVPDDKAEFEHLKKSGTGIIAVGIDEELNYWTLDDIGTLTEGAQSFKYYLQPTLFVYDRITVGSAYGGTATLTKVDSANADVPLAEAVYSLYKSDDTLVRGDLTTDSDGKITVKGLEQGDYYFKEITAPEGYKLNTDKVSFTITIATSGVVPDTRVGGGLTEITTTDGVKIAADKQEVFIAGPDKNGSSPDVTLTAEDAAEIKIVRVNYSNLEVTTEGTTSESLVVRTFTNLNDAQVDINAEKNANRILGPVSISVLYANPNEQNPVEVTTTDEALPRTEVTVNKTWIDHEDFTGTHPEITIRLLKDNVECATTVLKDGVTSYTFEDLLAEKQDGTKIVYTITEDRVPGYTSSVNGVTVTNTFENTEKTSVSGKKDWQDYNNALSTRPETITVKLYKTTDKTTPVSEITVTPDLTTGEWSYVFSDLPKYEDNGKKVVYEVQEVKVDDYTAVVDGNNITNTLDSNKNNMVKVEGEKTWSDYNNGLKIRPDELVITLLQSGAVYKTYTTNNAKGWKYSFENLPKFDAEGKEYTYTIKEAKVPEGYTSVVDGKNITNTLNPKRNEIVKVAGKKVWVDYNNKYKTRPDEITVNLYQNESKTPLKTVKVNEKGGWKYSFENLPRVDDAGKEYKYTVKEDAVKNYVSTISEDQKTITNAFNGQAEISFTKVGKYVEGCSDSTLGATDPGATVPLTGVEFTVYKVEESKTGVQTAVSDEKGLVQFKNLPLGKYMIKETKAAAGYLLDETSYYADAAPGKFKGLTTKDGTLIEGNKVVNDVHRTKITFTKVNEQKPSEVLPGSTYGLYRMAVARAAFSRADAEDGLQLIAKAVTDKNGVLTFDGVLLNTEYVVKELQAPNGSYISTHPIKISFGADADGNISIANFDNGKGTATVDPKTGEITWLEPSVEVTFIKIDEKDNPLAGAELEVRDKDNKVVAEWTSTKEPYKLTRVLVIGETYKLVETKAPTGYKIADPISFTIDDKEVGPGENKTQIVKMVDKLLPKETEKPTTKPSTTKPNTTTKPGTTTSQKGEAAKTGDTTAIIPWIIILVGAGGIVIALRRKKAKKTQ